MHAVGANDASGRYARMEFDLSLPPGLGPDTPIVERSGRSPTLTIEWSRLAQDLVCLRASCAGNGALELVLDFPWDWTGRFEPTLGGVRAHAADGSAVQLATAGAAAFAVRDGSARGRVPAQAGLILLARVERPDPRAPDAGALTPAAIRQACERLDEQRDAYEARRLTLDGRWRDAAQAVTQSLHWTVLLQPESGRLYTPAGRRWIFPTPNGSPDHWTVFGWDSWFNALLLAQEAPDHAWAALHAGLATQYPDGCVPNWRGRFGGTPDRAQPPLASFAALRLFLRTGDRAALARTFSALQRWSRWWAHRDGDGSGLYAWGSTPGALSSAPPPWERNADGRQRAAWESGQDDLPLWDDGEFDEQAGTLRMHAVDLCSYRALDLECLARIATELGHDDLAARYAEEWEQLRDRVNRRLWHDHAGVYRCRHWGGRWSERSAASDFLPLVAGLPDHEQARRLVAGLTDPDRWWGRFLVPTVPRDDPAFPDQQYWRGSIWPPLNYLLYHGLRRTGFHAEARLLAERSAEMFLEDRRRYGLCRENFDARTGRGAGQRHQSWGPLFAVMLLEEMADATPWDDIRMGTHHATESITLRNLRIAGMQLTVAIGPDRFEVSSGPEVLLRADRPLVLRRCRFAGARLEAEAETLAPARVVDLHGTERTLGPGLHPLALPF